jgi:mannose-6-phosphate isomerase-like protein (cupin superfamily)
MKTSTEVYYILKGKGLMHIDSESKEVGAGSTVYIPPNSVQSIKNLGREDLEFICIVNPPWAHEDEAD